MKRIAALVLLTAAPAVAEARDAEQFAVGLSLLHRWNCAACHEELPAGAPGPKLDRVAERLSPGMIENFLLRPDELKPGTRKPHLFAPAPRSTPAQAKANAARAKEEAAAVAEYLHSLPRAPLNEEFPNGNPQRGKLLFESIGCRSCHPPDDGRRSLYANKIVLARSYPPHELAAYLLEPFNSLMPSLKLNRQEAADLAALLRQAAPPERDRPRPLAPDRVARGRTLYHARRCSSCHGDIEKNALPPLARIPIRDWKAGCLSKHPSPGLPRFPLTDSTREAMQLAALAQAPPTPDVIVDHFLIAYRCYSCHQRNGLGGPLEKDRPFFRATEQMAESYGDFGIIPPKLDHVGRKLTRAWLRKILLDGHGEVRPYLATRMPHYRIPRIEVEKFLTALEQADRRNPPIEIDVSGLPRHQRGHYGRDLMGTKGLNCITCHGLKDRRALGAPNIDLTHTAQRLRPAYFKELLLDPQSVQPGTLMPPLFLNRPKANQEIEQLWTYFKELDQRRLPEGLLRTEDFELRPEKNGTPIVLRTFMEQVGTHAVAVGYPAGTHLAFDARTSRWVLAWKGRFLDAMSIWDDRYATPTRPLGQEVYRFPPVQTERQFRGFRLTRDGVPVFLYEENGIPVEDRIDALPNGRLRRTLKRGKRTTHQDIVLHNKKASFRDEK